MLIGLNIEFSASGAYTTKLVKKIIRPNEMQHNMVLFYWHVPFGVNKKLAVCRSLPTQQFTPLPKIFYDLKIGISFAFKTKSYT